MTEHDLDLCLELQHTLGSGLQRPFRELGRRPDRGEVARALDTALLRTHALGARELWARFQARAGAEAEALDEMGALRAAVELALSYEGRGADPQLDWRTARADLTDVSAHIRDLVMALVARVE